MTNEVKGLDTDSVGSVKVSEVVRERLRNKGVRFFANDNISEHVSEFELNEIQNELTYKFQDVLDALKLTQKDKKDLNALLLKQANVKSVRAPKKRGGKVLRSLYANGSKVTTKGRKVYKDKDGQLYSERTETVQLKNGKWVNYPTVDRDGNKIPEELFEKLVESQVTKKGVVDFITVLKFISKWVIKLAID